MARYSKNGIFTDGNGRVVTSGTISVFLAGTSTAASIYTAATGGSAVNSVTSDSTEGNFIFYVDLDDYAPDQLFDITLSKTDFKSKTYSNVRIFTDNGDSQAETATAAAPTLKPYGSTSIDSSSNAVDGTLGSGQYIGQVKTIVMTEASNSSTISITNHETSDPEVATFDAVDEAGVFLWTGTEWVTLYATCTFV